MRRWRELLEQKGHSDLRAHHEAATGQNPAGALLKMMGTMVGSSTGIIYREESSGCGGARPHCSGVMTPKLRVRTGI